MVETLDEALNVLGQQFVDSLRYELNAKRINASGGLSRSVSYEVVDINGNPAIWINYDDYVNFEIEILTQDQIKEYKKNEPNNADDSFIKLQVLKKMLDTGLISFQEYALKKEEILKSYN